MGKEDKTIEYCPADEFYFEILMRNDMFDKLIESKNQFGKFDSVVGDIKQLTKKRLQKLFDEVFGEGVMIVD